jgi:hypothetical protein
MWGSDRPLAGDVRHFRDDGGATVDGISKRNVVVAVVLEPDERHTPGDLIDLKLITQPPDIEWSRAGGGARGRGSSPASTERPRDIVIDLPKLDGGIARAEVGSPTAEHRVELRDDLAQRPVW